MLEQTGYRGLSRSVDFVQTLASGDVVSMGLKVGARRRCKDLSSKLDLINEQQVMNIFFRKLISSPSAFTQMVPVPTFLMQWLYIYASEMSRGYLFF